MSDFILSRRSVRQFKKEELSDHTIELLLKYAMAAPSAGNEQPWEFLVIKERAILNDLIHIHPYAESLAQASCAILVMGNLSREIFKGFWVQDCSAAIQNILLGAHSNNLGAVWLGIYPMQERVDSFRHYFKLPDDIIPLALIPIGVPGEKQSPSQRFDPKKIHFNNW